MAAVRASAASARLPRAEAAKLPAGSRRALDLAADVRYAIAKSASEQPGALTIAAGDGYLVVRGRVTSPEQRDEVLRIARAAAGKTEVVDKLVIVR
jgi:osmotically-inducible protein OsmY